MEEETNNKTETVLFMVTVSEKKQIEDAAKEADRSISNFCRNVVLVALNKKEE